MSRIRATGNTLRVLHYGITARRSRRHGYLGSCSQLLSRCTTLHLKPAPIALQTQRRAMRQRSLRLR